jgi:carbonic anhydrase
MADAPGTKDMPGVSPAEDHADAPALHSNGQEAPVWSYEGRSGPEYWGDLCPEYATCRSGKHQSPIDIAGSLSITGQPLSFDYQPISPIRMVRTNWTLQVLGVPSCGVTIGEQWYELLDFHFHTPAEHRMNGELAAMELHLVHQSSASELAVVGILIDEGARNEPLGMLFDNLQSLAGTDQILGGQIDPAALLPEDHSYYRYAGSRTTPPCQEGIDWFILQERIECSAAQIGAFRTLFELNARPVQALHGREIIEYRIAGLQADNV